MQIDSVRRNGSEERLVNAHRIEGIVQSVGNSLQVWHAYIGLIYKRFLIAHFNIGDIWEDFIAKSLHQLEEVKK